MNNNLIVKYCVLVLLFAGLLACGNDTNDTKAVPEIPEEKPIVPVDSLDDAIKIENLQTRLRIVEASYALNEMWRANPKNLILNYSHTNKDESYTHFGYTDADGQVLLCEVINFPDTAKKWQGEFVYTPHTWVTITETNVQMSGKVRLYTDEQGEKYGTFELTSLEPTGPTSVEPTLQMGVYVDTYPDTDFRTRIEFIDNEIMIIENPGGTEYTYTYKYEIRKSEHAIMLTEINGLRIATSPSQLFFRVVNNTTFEIDYLHNQTADKSGSLIMTFEKKNN